MDLEQLLKSTLLVCGLVGILMVIMAGLAFMKKRQLIKDQVGILIIVLVLLFVMILLSVAEN